MQAGHRHPALDLAHGEGHDDVDDDVDDGRGGEGLEHLEREFLHGARARGELHQPDGERDRAVLDDVEKLRGQRRQDDAIGHRQQHVAVGLRQREPERERRHALAAGEARDAGAHLLGDARRGVEAERDHGGVERGVRKLLEPVADRGRQQLGQHEIPEEHLHQQRDVAEQLDIGVAEPDQPGKGVVRMTPTSDPRASARHQAVSAVASVQPVPSSSVSR